MYVRARYCSVTIGSRPSAPTLKIMNRRLVKFSKRSAKSMFVTSSARLKTSSVPDSEKVYVSDEETEIDSEFVSVSEDVVDSEYESVRDSDVVSDRECVSESESLTVSDDVNDSE